MFHDAYESVEQMKEAERLQEQEMNQLREQQELEAYEKLSKLKASGRWGSSRPVEKTRQDERDEANGRKPTVENSQEDGRLGAQKYWVGDALGLGTRVHYNSWDMNIPVSKEVVDAEDAAYSEKEAAADKEYALRQDALEIEKANSSVRNVRHLAYGFAKMFRDYVSGDEPIPAHVKVGNKEFTKSELEGLKGGV